LEDRRNVPLNIKDPEVYQLARQVAALTGETLTETVRRALRERLQREESAQTDPQWIEKLREISDRCAARPVLDHRSNDELVGYDELGVPANHGD
jgi:antitoxin VapB